MRGRTIVWIIIGSFAVQSAMAVTTVAVPVVVMYRAMFVDDCNPLSGRCTTDIDLATIEELSGVDFPDGTEVVSAKYEAAMDWDLSADLRLPAGVESPTAVDDQPWDGSKGTDGACRRVTETVEADGRVRLDIQVFGD